MRPRRVTWRLRRRLAMTLISLLLATTSVLVPDSARANDEVGLPVLAYYYIWYHATSWDRAKSDLPLLGRYSSDERSVMLKHARAARAAGLDGFLVSWKHTPELDRRLAVLAEVARETGLRLGIVYQGLDFYRRPLPARRVGDDIAWFAANYGHDPVFSLFGGPLVIWTGTWDFTPEQVRRVAGQVNGSVALVASQRSAEEYAAIAPYVDGDAYYWSSMDPTRDTHAQERLDELGEAVHRDGGLWIPSAAPGFDTTLLGGTRVVPRRHGATLRAEWRMALDSSPDAVGMISWNEFSENSHIEPSSRYGNETLRTLAAILSATVPDIIAADSSAPGAGEPGYPVRAALLLLVAFGVVGGSLMLIAQRRLTARLHPNGLHRASQP